MRLFLAILAAMLLLFGTVACGGSPGPTASTSLSWPASTRTLPWRVSLGDQDLGIGQTVRLRTRLLHIVATLRPGSASKHVILDVTGFLHNNPINALRLLRHTREPRSMLTS